MFAISSLKRSVTLLTSAVCCVSSLWAVPAVNDPYAGQYDVLTTPRNYPNAYRQGELIVKLRTENVAAPVKLKGAKGKVMATASAKGLNALISKYGLEEAEELMPLTGANVTPKMLRAKSLNGKDMTDSDLSSLYVLRFDTKKVADIISVAKEFGELEEVEYAEPNYIVYACSTGTVADYTTDPMYSKQWGIPAIGLDKLWNAPVVNHKRPVIAILDTGVDITHPDLADNIWTNELEANGADNADDDGNGFADDIHGWDFVNQSPRMRDNNGHGTHCAGIAAACGGNGIGITGANPDALIMPITVMQSDGTGDVATIIKGIDYAAANGADVLSMSFGGYYDSQAERDALGKAYQKAVLVAAAGNDYKCIYPHNCPVNKKLGAPMFPAAYNFVLGVEASADTQGGLAAFSNFDDDGPITSIFADLYNYELRAPGTNILSTFPGGQYKVLNGTSMACPLAAGAISRLMMARDISSKEELFGDLINTAKGNINIFDAYSLTDADRKPTLALVTYRLDDAKMGDGDGRPDAGETIRIYPTFRNSWGNARNITYSIRLAETEDPEIVEFMDGESHFISNLSSYASAEAESPFILKISPDCVDGRHISLVLTATCDNISESLEQEIIFEVENGVELGGII
ncbi:MAG: S8 family serine peptidase, partial [Paramuribaculum sp.]|nr:S8 family serine peptidase [Paramuribaculum sp.]